MSEQFTTNSPDKICVVLTFLLVSARPTFAMMALALHETNPGHHLQVRITLKHFVSVTLYFDICV